MESPFKDGAESVKDELAKRMRSPFVGAFVISWCFVNYEFLIVVFSDGEYATKLKYIAWRLFPGVDLWHTFGLPLVLAATSTLVIPLVNLATRLWNKGVDILDTQIGLWVETKRRVSDPELRARIRQKTYEVDSMRDYARGLALHNSATSARMFEFGVIGVNFEDRLKHDFCKLPGVSVSGALALPEGFKRGLENTGFSRQGYHTLKQLRDEIAIGESQLTAKFAPDLDYGRTVLSMMHGGTLLRFIWDSGYEPSYELSKEGRIFLDLIEEKYATAFSLKS